MKSRHIDEDAPWKTHIGPSQQLKKSKLLIGEATKKCASESSVTEKDLFYSLVRQFYEVLTRTLTQSLPFDNLNLRRLVFLQSSRRKCSSLENDVIGVARRLNTVLKVQEIDELR